MENQIKIIYEDENLLVIDKPAGLLVHNPEGQQNPTVIDYILRRYPEMKKLTWPDAERQGIVHRLDKDTSGLLIVAKNPEIQAKLQTEFQERKIKKTYLALAVGKVDPPDGKIEAAIVRGKAGKQKIQNFSFSFSKKIRPAVTFYKTVRNYIFENQTLTLLEVKPQTGRMHQIRVHLKYIGYPILGDPLYNTKQSRNISKELGMDRQFLHAEKLEFTHPLTQKEIRVESELPADLENILEKIK